MDKYTAAWNIQWIKGTLNGKHPDASTGYIHALKLCFEDKDAKHEVDASLEKVRYDGCIRHMFRWILMHIDMAIVSEVALMKIILDRLNSKINEQMHTIDVTG